MVSLGLDGAGKMSSAEALSHDSGPDGEVLEARLSIS